jgi:hypothetical protein
MKKTLLLCGLLLILVVPVASAAGASLSWGNYCWGDVGSSTLLTWACDSNTNTGIRMTCSFSVDAAHDDFVAAAVYLEGRTEEAFVPDWWRMSTQDPTDCRWNAIMVSADYSVLPQYEAGGVCKSAFGENFPSGGIGSYTWSTNRMSVNAAWATPVASALEAGQQYFLCQFRILATKTVDGCAGCSARAVWGLNHIRTEYNDSTYEFLYANPFGDNPHLFWQGELPTPASNATWGQIKGLYR